MNRVLSGREEILRVERRLYTDSMSSVLKSLTALEHKYEDMHSRELISENRFLQYMFDLLRIRFNVRCLSIKDCQYSLHLCVLKLFNTILTCMK